jgi:sialate O-acetylesterase
VPAAARIEHDTVVVSAAGVASPQAVRYAWAELPDGNLCNRAGLPAAPFRNEHGSERGATYAPR